jgi:uncharacterized protein
MRIVLDQIGVQPRAIDEVFAGIEIGNDGQLEGDTRFVGTIRKEGVRVIVEGALTAAVRLPCSRCIETSRLAIESAFIDVLIDSEYEPADAELELSNDALDESLVIGGEIELAELIRERILLELPEMHLCSEDCKGLCPKCGINRNSASCICSDKEIDPRWAALKNLN